MEFPLPLYASPTPGVGWGDVALYLALSSVGLLSIRSSPIRALSAFSGMSKSTQDILLKLQLGAGRMRGPFSALALLLPGQDACLQACSPGGLL